MNDEGVSTLVTAIDSFLTLVGGILRLDPDAYQAVFSIEDGYNFALAVLLLGGISLGLGQSVVLFANRVRRRRFVIHLLLSGIVLLLGVLFWAGSVWLLAQILAGGSVTFTNVFISAAISTSPLLFGFFVLLPYLGILTFQILRIWALLIYLNVIETSLEIDFWWALGISLLGWVFLEAVTRIPLFQFDRLRNWYWRLSTGTPRRLEIEEIVQRFIKDLREAARIDKNYKDEDKK